jgi:hypothetical protein
MLVQNSTSKLAFISGMGRQPSTAPTHHTQSAENVCVDHRRRNGPNAARAGLSQSFGENLNAENFFEIFKVKLHETLLFLNKNKKFVLKMQSLQVAKRSMRTRPGSDFAWSFYTAKLHIFSLLSQKLPYIKVNLR